MRAEHGISRWAVVGVALAVLGSSCSFEETAIGGGVASGHYHVRRARGLLVDEPVSVRVYLQEYHPYPEQPVPLVGERASLEVDGAAIVTSPASGTTGQDGSVTFTLKATAAGTVTITAFAEPPGLDRVALAPLELEFVATRPEMLVLEAQQLATGNQALAVARGDVLVDEGPELVLLDAAGTLYAWKSRWGSLSTPVSYELGQAAAGLAIAETTGDDLDDVFVMSRSGSSGVELLRSTGTSLASPVALLATIASPPLAIAAGGLDGSGAGHLALLDGEGTASVFRLQAPVAPAELPSIAASGSLGTATPSCLALGDVDGDGLTDLAIGAPDQLLLVRGSTGTSTPFTIQGISPLAIALGEVAAAGPRLVAIAGRSGTTAGNAVHVYRLDAGAQPALTAVYTGRATGAVPVAIAIGDLTTDGIADVAVLSRTAGSRGSLDVVVGLDPTLPADAAFAPAAPLEVPEEPKSMAIGDWTFEGFLDVAVASWGQPLTVFLGR